MTTPLDLITQRLLQAQRIVVFTGAGMSADSGIATFRNDPDSYWSQYDPKELASPSGWQTNKQRVWAWYEARRAKILAAQPNAGHTGIAQLQQVLRERTGRAVQVDVVTQNVDDLHERAGSSEVTHVHGSMFAPRCAACHRPGAFAADAPDIYAIEVEPPRCQHCGGYIRPGVVWFGEMMPQEAFRHAEDLVQVCDAMLVIGTSGVVFPAAELPIMAHQLKKFVAEINPVPSRLAQYVDVQWPEAAAVGVHALVERLRVGG